MFWKSVKVLSEGSSFILWSLKLRQENRSNKVRLNSCLYITQVVLRLANAAISTRQIFLILKCSSTVEGQDQF